MEPESSRKSTPASTARRVRGPRVLDAPGARLAAADLLSRRAWTQAELTARLERRGAPAEIAAAVVADLVARGHVDDRAFADSWVEARSARGIGVTRLRAELRARGVARPLIDSALAGTDPERQLEEARAAARRRLPGLRRGRPDRIGARLHDHLLRRGYPAAVAARVVRETLSLSTEEDTS